MLHTHTVLFFQNIQRIAVRNVQRRCSLSGSKLRKPDYVRELEKELDTNLGKYEAFIKTLWDTKSIFLNINLEEPGQGGQPT